MFYYNIYHKLCKSKKTIKEQYGPGSGLHRHRIKPGHMGGEYNEENITYLTPREHVIAHYLLWKIYKNPNNLRSMNMLGAKLTVEQRKIVGVWCHENKIGWHKYKGTEFHREYSLKGLKTQRKSYEETGNKQNFYYWSTEEGRKERASMGGSASWEVQKRERNALPYCTSRDPEIRKRNASKAAKVSAKFPVTDGVICKKLKTEEERKKFLSENPNFRSGGRPYERKNKEKSNWIHKDHENKMVKISALKEFLSKGWEMGRSRKRT
jgi:hypothetical protein